MELFIALLVFLSVTLTIVLMANILENRKKALVNRLKRYVEAMPGDSAEPKPEKKKRSRETSPFSRIGRTVISGDLARKMEIQLMRAEIPMRGEEFLVISIFGALIAGVAGGILFGGVGPGFVLMILTVAIIYFYITSRKSKRGAKLNSQIGDALTVMSNSLRAGYSFQQAMDLAGREMNGPLSVEFRRTIREINLGTPIEEALLNLGNRVSSDDLELVVTAVLIQRQIGGNLAEIFDNISFTIRERIRIKGEIRTLTAQGRMSGMIIGLMPPALFGILMLMNPAYMGTLVTTSTGLMILGGGAISEILGVLFIRKIIHIEV